jgi:hypothetical protein
MLPSRALHLRLDAHRRVAAALTALTDDELAALIDASGSRIVGAGGAGSVIDVDAVPVFLKRLPLTDQERAPAFAGSTANVFGLPAHVHVGVGSPGFGAWRELVATRRASDWVHSGRHEGFLLLHHWRVLPGAPSLADEFRDVERTVAFWGGHPAMRDRLQALAEASASVVLFLEHVPHTLAAWLAGGSGLPRSASPSWVETQLLDLAAFTAARGLVHFDAHFDNVLTDGRQLHLADLGLAAGTGFVLSPDEVALVEHARTHDLAYARMRLVNWAISTFGDPSCARDPVARHAAVRAFADGASTAGLPEPAAGIVRRHAPVAAILDAFYAELFNVRRDAPYPADAVRDALDRSAGAS